MPTHAGRSRRPVAAAALAAALAAAVLVPVLPAGTSDAAPPDGTLRWTAEPGDGLEAFAGVEEDRKHSHPGVDHIKVVGETYRFDMHVRDRDGSDRQRQEVRGMSADGRDLDIMQDQTWRFTYAMYIPRSLKATTSFTHIMQMKEPGSGSPLVVMSLRERGGRPTIELRSFLSGVTVGSTDLAPLQDRWVTTEVEIRFSDGTGGRMSWVLEAGGRTVVEASKTGIDTWIGEEDRVRPKWGIYRSVKDEENLEDTFLLLRDLRAYQL
jgi:hypothetical protein